MSTLFTSKRVNNTLKKGCKWVNGDFQGVERFNMLSSKEFQTFFTMDKGENVFVRKRYRYSKRRIKKAFDKRY